MVGIRIDRDMLTEDLLALRALIPVDNEEARKKLREIMDVVAAAPTDEKKAQFPRINSRRG
jgi:hypothetical protein